MFKKSLILLTLAFVMMPMFAQAYSLTTRINKIDAPVNGQIQVMTTPAQPVQTTAAVTKILANTLPATDIVITPAANYVISKVQKGATYLPVTPTGQTITIPANNAMSTTINVWFDKVRVAVSATAGVGGTASPTGVQNLQAGTTKAYTFTPAAGKNVIAINGLPAGTVLAPAVLPAAVNTPVVATITVPATGPVTMSAVFTAAIANAGVPQTKLVNTLVTLDGAASTGATSYLWTQIGGPVVALSDATASNPTFTPAATGVCKFTLAINDDASTAVATSVIVTDSYAEAMRTACQNCHQPQNISSAQMFANWSSSKHEDNAVNCSVCHVGTDTGAHPGTVASVGAVVCADCHNSSAQTTAFINSKHWINHLETGPEFAGGAVNGVLDANNSYTTTENGALVTCAYRCHFKPGMGPDPNKKSTGGITYTDPQTGAVSKRPTGDSCLACHDAHKLEATYKDTCLTCHSGSKHGRVPNEFFGSKHWQNNFEYGAEFANQLNTIVVGGSVVTNGTIDGVMNANDAYTTTENGAATTCAYRCHFRPGMGPYQNVGTVLANGKSTSYITYTDTTGKYGVAGTVYSRPGGNACMACHDPHGLEATTQSTCYTCHAGGNHGWSVAAFEKSTHFSGYAAKTYYQMDKNSCTACHNAHSTEAEFANLSTANTLHTAGVATGCQKCHEGDYGIFNADRTGKAPHFQTNAPGADKFYPTGSYDGGGATCVDCHYHNNTINAGWAKGGHASTTSVPLVTSSADNWNRGTKRGANISTDPVTQYGGDYTAQASVSDCQRCHTAAGFKLFYDSAFKNVSTVREGTFTSAPITCDACHVPKTPGTLLYNGAVRPLATGLRHVKTYVGNAKHLPTGVGEQTTFMNFSAAGKGYANSNVCIPCHAGRGTGKLIKQTFAVGSESATLARDIIRIGTDIYAHFASASGVVNGSSAYEFNPPAVANTHMKAGTATQGACIGCHMTSTEGHSLESATFALDGTINGFATTACAACHGVTAPALTPAGTQTSKENFQAALNLLRNMLLEKGFDGLQAEGNIRPGERVTMDMSLGFATYAGPLSKKDFAERNAGACFNWWQFGGKADIAIGDPAAYVHNPTYTRQVIKETMDWLDNFAMDNSITATVIDDWANTTLHPLKVYGPSDTSNGVAVDAAKAKAYFGLQEN